LTSILSIVPTDVVKSDFDRLARHVASMPAARRRLLATRCRGLLRKPSIVRDTAARVVVCKLLCATAPDSAATIRQHLELGRGRDRYEVQFTLLCFLDQIPAIPRARSFARTIPELIEHYLMNVPADTGRAAWMAGHMLGEHWPRRAEAIHVLMNVISNGRYKAGREAAKMALEDVVADGSVAAATRKKVQAALKEIDRQDS
jgi:hypothetical protein